MKKLLLPARKRENHIVNSVIEHPAIINPCRSLEAKRFKVTDIRVDEHVKVNPKDIENAMTEGGNTCIYYACK